MKKRSDIILSVLFVAFILTFGLLLIFIPDALFSENENRVLAQMPDVSLQNILDGSFESDFESYITDQFPFRDFFVSVNTSVSVALLHKRDINGVYIGSDGYLLEKFENIDTALMQKQINAVSRFSERFDVPVYFAVVPTSVSVYKDKLPAFAPAETVTDSENISNQKDYIDLFYFSLPETVNTIDVYSVLVEHKNEYIYYRTDHHWTTLAAFYAYEAICKEIGIESDDISDFDIVSVTDEFYGTLFSKGNFSVPPDTISRFDRKKSISYTVSFDGAEPVNTLYDENYLDKKDKYAYFMSGNTAHTVINTDADTGKTAVFIKDSYTHCLLPFFISHFDTIHMIDPRYIGQNLTDYISALDPDQIIIIYNAKTLSEDNDFIKLGYSPKT